MSNPDLPPSEQPKTKLSPLAQTFELIGKSAFKLGVVRPVMELNYPMWSAAANLTTREYACMRKLKIAWLNGSKAG